MNGARTTFMRRGYLLTALAAVVLLAASPGTAQAQVLSDVEITLEVPRTVGEGGDLTVNVSGSAMVATTPATGDVAHRPDSVGRCGAGGRHGYSRIHCG